MEGISTSKYEVVNHNCNALSKDEKNATLYASGSIAILSSFCCILALVAVALKQLYRKVIYRLATYQVTASLCDSFNFVLGFMLIGYDGERIYYQVVCKATAFLGQFLTLVNLFFISWLTFHLFAFVVFFKDLKRLEWLYISSSVLIPLLIACIPFITDSYGSVGIWCYIRSLIDDGNCTSRPDIVGITEQFTLYYGPAAIDYTIIIMAIAVMTFTMAYRTWRHKIQGHEQQLLNSEEPKQYAKALKQILPLFTYPIIYFVLFLTAFSNRIYTAKHGTVDFGITLAHAVTQSFRGFFVGLALIFHVILTLKKSSIKGFRAEAMKSIATYAGVTSYTSEAVTTFPLPNETDVDDRVSLYAEN